MNGLCPTSFVIFDRVRTSYKEGPFGFCDIILKRGNGDFVFFPFFSVSFSLFLRCCCAVL